MNNSLPRKLLAKAPHREGEAGFTIIQLLVGMGLISITAAMFFQMQGNVKVASKSLDSSASYEQIEAQLKTVVKNFLSEIRAVPGCVNYQNAFNNKVLISDSGQLPIRVSTDISAKSLFSSNLENDQINMAVNRLKQETETANALDRCRKQIRPNNQNNSNQNTFYFCLSFGQEDNLSGTSPLSSGHAFAEVAVELLRTSNMSSISCAEYQNTAAGVGADVYLSTYWLFRGDQYSYKSRHAKFFMGKQ